MLLYPFEEQFDVPALSVEFCDCQGLVSQMVGKATIVTLVSGDACVEVSTGYKRHKLSKYGLSCEHRQTQINWSAQSNDSSRVHEKTFVID